MDWLTGTVTLLWAIPAVKALVILIIGRFVPNKWIFNLFYGLGVTVTGGGRQLLGRLGLSFLWEKFENIVENSIGAAWNGFRAGLNSDDSSKIDAMKELTEGV